MAFKKATDVQLYARIGLYAPSGGGKSVGALRITQGLGGSIAVIDSERGSSAKAKRVLDSKGNPIITSDYDIWELDSMDINDYTEAILASADAGYNNLIIDSMSHAWYELLQENEIISQNIFKGNSWAAWSKSTPKQRAFIEAVLRFPGHIIATMRSKTEWTMSERKMPQRVGLAPVQGKEIEYEFDMLISLNPDHSGFVEKDRTGKYQDKTIKLIDEAFGRELADWLRAGKIIEMVTSEQKEAYKDLVIDLGLTDEQLQKALNRRHLTSFDYASKEQAEAILSGLEAKVRAKQNETVQ